jgi:DNA-binding response OmpR family regulator
VHRDGQLIQLTPREGDILDYLIRNRHRVVTRDDLLLDVWHYKSANVETRTVDIHIVGLRRKVEPNPAEADVDPDGARQGLPLVQLSEKPRAV